MIDVVMWIVAIVVLVVAGVCVGEWSKLPPPPPPPRCKNDRLSRGKRLRMQSKSNESPEASAKNEGMMRYLVFACDSYYPAGGIGDLLCRTDDWKQVVAKIDKLYDDVHVYDLEQDEIVGGVDEFYYQSRKTRA